MTKVSVALATILLSAFAINPIVAHDDPHSIPGGLVPYTDLSKVRTYAKLIVTQLKSAKLERGNWRCTDYEKNPLCRWDLHYQDGVHPILKNSGYIPSPCEEEKELISIHRGFGWLSGSYKLFTRTIERKPVTATWQHLAIQRFGRAVLLGVVSLNELRQTFAELEEVRNLPAKTRSELSQFLRLLLMFEGHYNRLNKDGDITEWIGYETKNASGRLVRKLNELTPLGEALLSTCLVGYLPQHIALADGRKFNLGSIYSGGIAMYSMKFWHRRAGEGTLSFAKLSLEQIIRKLQ